MIKHSKGLYESWS